MHLLIALVCFIPVAAKPYRLQCEHLTDPLGIDIVHPRLSWELRNDGRNIKQQAYMLVVSTDPQGHHLQWRLSNNSNAQIITYSGKALQPYTHYYWSVTVKDQNGLSATSTTADFETGPLSSTDWQGDWITDKKDINLKPAPYVRKGFTIQKPIISARAYIAVAGLYELYINSEKIGDHVLDPAYTRFDRRNLYVTYDVTKQLQHGQNAIGVLLGNGWYNMQSPAVWFFDKAPWRGRPCFCMDLRITYNDGTTETISTDKSWQTSMSNITFNSI